MTGLPATTIGMVDRGLLAAGMAADLTVFDPEDGDRSRDVREPDGALDGDPTRAGERALCPARRLADRSARGPRARADRPPTEPRDEARRCPERPSRGSAPGRRDARRDLGVDRGRTGRRRESRPWQGQADGYEQRSLVRHRRHGCAPGGRVRFDGRATVSLQLGDDYRVSGGIPTVKVTAGR